MLSDDLHTFHTLWSYTRICGMYFLIYLTDKLSVLVFRAVQIDIFSWSLTYTEGSRYPVEINHTLSAQCFFLMSLLYFEGAETKCWWCHFIILESFEISYILCQDPPPPPPRTPPQKNKQTNKPPPPTHTPSLSLSHTHTHTHTSLSPPPLLTRTKHKKQQHFKSSMQLTSFVTGSCNPDGCALLWVISWPSHWVEQDYLDSFIDYMYQIQVG